MQCSSTVEPSGVEGLCAGNYVNILEGEVKLSGANCERSGLQEERFGGCNVPSGDQVKLFGIENALSKQQQKLSGGESKPACAGA